MLGVDNGVILASIGGGVILLGSIAGACLTMLRLHKMISERIEHNANLESEVHSLSQGIDKQDQSVERLSSMVMDLRLQLTEVLTEMKIRFDNLEKHRS